MTLQPPFAIRHLAKKELLRLGGAPPPARAVAALLFAAALCIGAQAAPPADAKPTQAEAPGKPKEQEAKAPVKAEYVTSVVCMGCHEEIYNNFIKRNVHRTLETGRKKGWQEKACESCHGPGSVHAESAALTDILKALRIEPGLPDVPQQSTDSGGPNHGRARSQPGAMQRVPLGPRSRAESGHHVRYERPAARVRSVLAVEDSREPDRELREVSLQHMGRISAALQA
jgi:hypothetical protein